MPAEGWQTICLLWVESDDRRARHTRFQSQILYKACAYYLVLLASMWAALRGWLNLSNALGCPLSFLKRCRNLLSQQRNFSTKTNQTYLGYWPYLWLHRSQTRRSKEHVPSKEKPESERVDGAGDNLGTPVKAPPPALLTKPVMISLTPQRKASLDKDDKITPR